MQTSEILQHAKDYDPFDNSNCQMLNAFPNKNNLFLFSVVFFLKRFNSSVKVVQYLNTID